MWENEMSIARQAAIESGKVLNRLFGQTQQITKKGDIDLVTEADLQSERLILRTISRHFPQDSIMTEESGYYNHHPQRIWIIDPLDGTTNFAHAFPVFAISIAFQFQRDVVLGVVFNPYMNEHFEAVKGMGSSLNNRPIKVSQTKELGDALLATGFPYDVNKRPDSVIELFKKFTVLGQGVRRPGSAAIDLCYVAAGRLDGFWEERLKPWDTAAGSLIVQEAGGRVSSYEGTPYSPYQKNIVAANPFIHEAMLRVLK